MRPLRVIAALGLLSIGATPLVAQRFIPQSALIAMVETHKASVLQYIDAAPDSMLTFRPTKGVRTFAEQIEHATWGNAFITHLSITGSRGVKSFGDSTVYRYNKAALRAYAIAAMDYTIERLRNVSDAAMMEEIMQFGKKIPRYRALMELLDHFPFTLGQAVPYMRMNGITPPVYTPF